MVFSPFLPYFQPKSKFRFYFKSSSHYYYILIHIIVILIKCTNKQTKLIMMRNFNGMSFIKLFF
jgi:hypothetical protein